MTHVIDFADFDKIDIRVGKILSAKDFPEARKPAYILEIDFGVDFGRKRSSAQLTANYEIEELEGRLVAAVMNFAPKQIGPIRSEVLVLGFPDENGDPVLIVPTKDVQLGGKLF